MTPDRRSARCILLVEDNLADVILMEEVLKSSQHQVVLHVVANGRDAIDYLKRMGRFTSAQGPDLILMDLSLPRIHGETVLQKIKGDPELTAVPVIIFTGSDSPADVVEAYRSHANSYVVKPIGLDQLNQKMETLLDYWFGMVELPADCTGSEEGR